jgi:hypothetical protein
MPKGKLYEYCILFHPKPTKDQMDRGESPKSSILVAPTSLLATDDKQVAMIASRAIPDTYTDKLEDVEIVVRPF